MIKYAIFVDKSDNGMLILDATTVKKGLKWLCNITEDEKIKLESQALKYAEVLTKHHVDLKEVGV